MPRFEFSPSPLVPPEKPAPDVELVPPPLEALAKPYLETAASVSRLAWKNDKFASHTDIKYALDVAATFLRPPDQEPASVEILNDPAVASFYDCYHFLGMSKDPQTGKFRHIEENKLSEIQRIWRRTNQATKTLEQVSRGKLVPSNAADFTGELLTRIVGRLSNEDFKLPARDMPELSA